MISRCFPYGKLKALTMSYDDGRHCDKKLIDIFNRYNIKGTFHLNSGTIDNEEIIDYVITPRQNEQEYKQLEIGIEKAKDAIIEYLKNGIDKAMNKFN